MIRVLITGSRNWEDADLIRKVFNQVDEKQEVTLISGACPDGADSIAEQVADELGWAIERHPADWDKWGKRAGYVRNQEMVDSGVDLCLAFIRNNSRGASMTADLATKAAIPTLKYHQS